MRRLWMIAATLAACAAAAVPAQASYESNVFSSMHWRMIGPFRGGRAIAVTGVPGNPTLFYMGTVAGGVWKTDDAGRTWSPIFDSQGIASIGAIAVAPSDPNVIYVGSGEADMRSNITYGNGMYRSADAGRTWTHIGLEDSRQISRIAVDPSDTKRIFVAALGHAYGPNSQRGIFRSTDGGSTWQRVLYKDQNTGAIDVAIDPHDPQTVFAALWQTRRPPWSIYPPSHGPGSGLYVSHDGGSTWKQVQGNGFPSNGVGRMGIGFARSDAHRIYAIVDAKKGGLYRSDDGGATWQLKNGDDRLWQRGWYFCDIAVDPQDADVVYISDTAFYRSTNGGQHFTAIKGSPDGDDFHQPWIDPTEPRRMVLGSDQGASITLNGGATWSSWYNQPTAQFYHIAADDRFPFRVYGAQQDNGSAMIAVESDHLGISTFDWQPIAAGGESGSIAPDPRDPNTWYGDNVTREDLTSRQTRALDPTTAHPATYRAEWTMPLVFSKADPRALYYGRQVLFRSADAGNTWQIISPDLTRSNPGTPANLDAPTLADNDGAGPRRGVIYAIAPSPLRSDEIWAGTDDGKIWLTADAGSHWSDVTPPQLTAWSKVGIIEASSFDAQTAYVAIDRHRLDDIRPYIYRTHDGGKHWTPIAGGIPAGAYVNAVREDPGRKGLLYAGTELGVYVSFDDGASWQSLRLNMPVVPVRDLVIRQDSLAIATHGRAFWVLDDLSPLRQMSTKVANSAAWLFEPEAAIRVRPHSDETERLPPEEPVGENREVGAFIDYVLKADSATPVRLAISDASGATVRKFSSADRPQSIDADRLSFPAFWARVSKPLAASAGMHRFVWDFQCAPLPGEPESNFGPGGPLAPPGRYTLRLTVAGKTWLQPLVVTRDPRVHATDADLIAQFKLARAIEALRVSTAKAYALATRRKLTAVAGGPPPSNPNTFGGPQFEFASLWAVGNALDALAGSVESADSAPTGDEYAAFAHWKGIYEADQAKLSH